MKNLSVLLLGGGVLALALAFAYRANRLQLSQVPVQSAGVVGVATIPTPTTAPPVAAPSVSVSPSPSPSSSPAPVLTPPVVSSPVETAMSTAQPSIPEGYVPYQIDTCNGTPATARLRRYPSLDQSAQIGVVQRGRTILLTGVTSEGDGLLWYEVANPVDPSQKGWIAGCFVR